MTDNRKITLDYVTEWQTNDEAWLLFELSFMGVWRTCGPCTNPINFPGTGTPEFRRKPRTITVTMPVPNFVSPSVHVVSNLVTEYATEADRDAALAAIREAMEIEKGKNVTPTQSLQTHISVHAAQCTLVP